MYADADVDGLRALRIVVYERSLDGSGAIDSRWNRVERCHNAVAHMLDFTAIMLSKSPTNQRVMRTNDFDRHHITQPSSHLCGSRDVREHNGPQASIHINSPR